MNDRELRAKLEALTVYWEEMAEALAPRNGTLPRDETRFQVGSCLWWRVFEVRALLTETSDPSAADG